MAESGEARVGATRRQQLRIQRVSKLQELLVGKPETERVCVRSRYSLRQRGSMKGVVNINTSPPTADGHKTYRGSQPCFR